MAKFHLDAEGHEVHPPPAHFAAKANIRSLEQYQEMYKESIESPETFWGRIAEKFHWQRKWSKVGPTYNFTKGEGPVSIDWFTGGKTNMCYNCIDRHVAEGKGDKVCFIYEGNDPRTDATIKMTYAEVLKHVQVWANVLKAQGVQKGDRVAVYMPMILDLPIVMLACTRIGAVHSVVFGGFAPQSLASRIVDSKAKVVITADGVMRGGKLIDLKRVADDAAISAMKQGVLVRSMIVCRRMGNDAMEAAKKGSSIQWVEGRDQWFHEVKETVPPQCPCEWVESEDPLFMLYTSGSTGTPKGVVHSTAGYMVGAYTTTHYTFDMQDQDIFWCTADCGWVTGHTYITYGPMLNGATQVIFEGVPTFPDAGRLWEVVDKHQVSVFYTAPTALRALMAKGDSYVKKHSRASLRLLGSVGEPINPEAWRWYHQVVGGGRCPIADTWWQTETGSIMIAPMPGATALKPGCASVPFFGVEPVVIDVKTGKELAGEAKGYLCIKKPWPSIMRTVYGDHGRFEATYFSQQKGYYFTGDGCRRDKDGYIWITGRVDDVINVSGHRIGTAEVESVFVGDKRIAESAVVGFPHPVKGESIYAYVVPKDGYIWITGRVDDVINVSGHRIGTAEVESVFVGDKRIAESAVVGFPHPVKGESIYAYVVPKDGVQPSDALAKELIQKIRGEIGSFAAPDVLHWAPTGVPKTRSGKIMRRILRKIAHNEEDQLGDISTLADPSVVEVLIKNKPGKKKSKL